MPINRNAPPTTPRPPGRAGATGPRRPTADEHRDNLRQFFFGGKSNVEILEDFFAKAKEHAAKNGAHSGAKKADWW